MNYELLYQINSPADTKKLSKSQLSQLCDELRAFLIETVLQSGGHFSGNLGVVELTVALHYLLDLPSDTLIWDVGHQSYPHKILTGRRELLKTIRKKDGISGFPNILESDYDSFGTGHSSTSISAALGMAAADQLKGLSSKHVAVIGDGSMTGGMAWEAMNNAGISKTNLCIIINDNSMGIDPNTGALGPYLEQLIQGEKENSVFADWGLNYYRVEDGHDLEALLSTLKKALEYNGPTVVHVRTVKGKGFAEAEAEQTKWHAVKYVKVTGQNENGKGRNKGDKYQDIFGRKLVELARKNKEVVAITPAMPSGSSIKFMMDELPERVFDVGIAEQHAVTFSAGLARKGLKPFCNIYSSFFQRAYDQFIHDVCLQKLNVTFFLDRAGIVGADGATHHGLYDIAYLLCLPETVLMAPFNGSELEKMMDFAMAYSAGPLVIRYPRGHSSLSFHSETPSIELGKGQVLFEGKQAVILSYGAIGDQAIAARELLQKEGLQVAVYDMRFAQPIDYQLLDKAMSKYSLLVTLENGAVSGGLGSAINDYVLKKQYKGTVLNLGFPKKLIGHAKPMELFKIYGLDGASIAELIKKQLAV